MMKLIATVLSNVFWVGLTVAVLGGGYFGYTALRDNRETLEPVSVSRAATAVETQPLRPWQAPLPVRGEGFVSAERAVSLSALAGGEIVYLHPAIADENGRFAKNDTLIRINDAAEQANLRKADADIAAAEAQLALERSDLLRTRSLSERGLTPEKSLEEAEARVVAAEYRLDGLLASKAVLETAVENKIVRAPFDGAILSHQVEVGAIVSPGQTLAEAYTDESLNVVVNLGEAEAALIPGLFDGGEADAHVEIAFAGATYATNGRVTDVAPALDARTRTLAVTITLDGNSRLRPVTGALPASGAPPALINAYAKVEISGASANGTYRIPSTALRGEDIWLTDNGTLTRVPARQLHIDNGYSFVVADEIADGARLVVSSIAVPVDGMAVQDVTPITVSATETTPAGDDAQ